MASAHSIKRMHAVFTGRVQGVGFRFTVCRIAEQFPVDGLVRNLSNGDVEVIAEGREQKLVALLHAIRDASVGRFITHEQIRWEAPSLEFDRFGVSF